MDKIEEFLVGCQLECIDRSAASHCRLSFASKPKPPTECEGGGLQALLTQVTSNVNKNI